MTENFEAMIYRQETAEDRQAAARASNLLHQSDTLNIALGRGDFGAAKEALLETNSCDWPKLFPQGGLALTNEEKHVKNFAAHLSFEKNGTKLELLEAVNTGYGLFFVLDSYVPRMTISGDACSENQPRL